MRRGIKRFSVAVTAVVVTGALATPVVMAQGVNLSQWWPSGAMGFNRITTIVSTGTLSKKDGQFWLQTNHGTFHLVGGTDSVLNRQIGKHVTVWGTQSPDNVITLSRIVPLNDEGNSAVHNDVQITTVTENNGNKDDTNVKKSVQINQSSENNAKNDAQTVVTSNSSTTVENNTTSRKDVHITQTTSGKNTNGRNVNTGNINIHTNSTTVTNNR
ncbi:MAG: hypothetical protein NTV39_00385 [Candidatus Saccharibacteria bacterium]|nr:hypothetical protein [Candidatus Saccharibacteria bacterium]